MNKLELSKFFNYMDSIQINVVNDGKVLVPDLDRLTYILKRHLEYEAFVTYNTNYVKDVNGSLKRVVKLKFITHDGETSKIRIEFDSKFTLSEGTNFNQKDEISDIEIDVDRYDNETQIYLLINRNVVFTGTAEDIKAHEVQEVPYLKIEYTTKDTKFYYKQGESK